MNSNSHFHILTLYVLAIFLHKGWHRNVINLVCAVSYELTLKPNEARQSSHTVNSSQPNFSDELTVVTR